MTFIIIGLVLISLYVALRLFFFTAMFSIGVVLGTACLIQPFPDGFGPVILVAAVIGLVLDARRWES